MTTEPTDAEVMQGEPEPLNRLRLALKLEQKVNLGNYERPLCPCTSAA